MTEQREPARVAIVSLGRDAAKGELRRVESWRLLFERAGATVEAVRVEPDRRLHLDGVLPTVRGVAAPERLAWSGRRLRTALDDLAPTTVVVVSARAFDPALTAGPWRVILDFVDSLSRSYRDRAGLVGGGLRPAGYHLLAAAHRRLERRLARLPLHTVAAGWSDARQLGAEWVPIVADPTLSPAVDAHPDRDVLFFGTLRYPPNVAALERLARLWPAVLAARPGTTALVAGSAPPPRVRELCARQGWELLPDFSSLAAVAARARISVAPLTHTAGIQIKVLDAAALGLPQVLRSPALSGLDPGFPLTPFDDDADFAAEVVRLLDRGDTADASAASVRHHVEDRYAISRWSDWARAHALD